jgi:hypothetical protein
MDVIKNIFNYLNKPKFYLIFANFLVVFFAILLTNLGILPFRRVSDFAFFAVIGLIFALYRPGWAFLFFIGTIALENINVAPVGFPIDIRPYQFFGAIAIAAVAVRYLSKRLSFKLVKLKWFDYVLIIFAASSFTSSILAAEKGIALKQSVILLSFVFLYFLVRNYIQTLADLKKVIPFFLSSSIVVVFYGIWQNIAFIKGLNSFEIMPGRPNATFTEADWLGIFLVFLIAVIYSVIYYFVSLSPQPPLPSGEGEFRLESRERGNTKHLISYTLYIILIPIYILLILTVSRSAWLGAGIVTLIFLKFVLTNAKFNPKYWQWKQFFRVLQYTSIGLFCSIGIVYVFHLTNFQLFNRAQSSASGLQKITIACETDAIIKNTHNDNGRGQNDNLVIKNNLELQKYGCRHINLEDIEKEKVAGNIVAEIYRPDPNVNVRKEIYQKSWQEIKKHPTIGIGWGNIGKILGTDERGTSLNSSNIFLEVWLGSGIIGLLAFLTVLGNIFIQSIRNLLKGNPNYKIVGLITILGFMALIIPNLFNAGIFLGILWVWLGVIQLKEI